MLNTDPGYEAWVAERASYLGGSEISAVIGMNPWKSAHRVWLEKKGHETFYDGSHDEAMFMGNFLEPKIAELYERDRGIQLVQSGMRRDPSKPWLAGNADRIAIDGTVGVELKNVGQHVAVEWGQFGAELAPGYHVLQCLWYMHLHPECERWDLCGLICGSRLVIRPIMPDPDTLAYMIDRGEHFWRHHIEGNNPPPLTGLDCDSDWVKAKYATGNPDLIAHTTAEINAVCHEYGIKRGLWERYEKDKDAAANKIKEFMGDATLLESSVGPFTWKNNQDGSTTDWKAIAEELLGGTKRPELIKKHTKVKKGSRVFITPFSHK